MQYLAQLTVKADLPTLVTEVASKYTSVKKSFVNYPSSVGIPLYAEGIDKISNPHMQISYFVLSCEV